MQERLDKKGERYRPNHATAVKLYYPYTHFPLNVRLSRQQIATFLAQWVAHRDFI